MVSDVATLDTLVAVSCVAGVDYCVARVDSCEAGVVSCVVGVVTGVVSGRGGKIVSPVCAVIKLQKCLTTN